MSDEELAKDLGPLAALTIGVGTMIGAGIFVLPGEAAAAAGPAVALSFVIGGVISLFTAMSASELGTAMPKAGGSYYYVNHALGPLLGSVAGWGNWMGLAFASAFYMLGFGDFLVTFLPVPALSLGPLALSDVQVSALLAGAVFVGVNYVGAKETGRLQNIIVITLVTILTAFSILGLLQADVSTLQPFFPAETGGVGAVLPATGLVFVSFLGFAKITTVAEELRNPGRNLPLAVIGSVVIVTVMYAIIMVVLMGVINWDILGASSQPVLDVAEIAFGTVGQATLGVALLTFAGLLATASSANASILASSRINFAMGRDALITERLNSIHPRFATPYRSIAVTGALILAFISVGSVEVLAKAGSVLHLVVYGLLNIALVVMRQADPEEYQPDFTVPLYPAVPILGALTSFGLIAFMDPREIALAGGFVVVGVTSYLLYGRHRAEKQGILGQYILSRREELPEPAVSAARTVQPDGGRFRVMVPVADPAHEGDLVALAAAIARARDGQLDLVRIVEVPDQTTLEYGADHLEEFDPGAETVLANAREDAERLDVPVETHTIVSHRSYEEVFDAAAEHEADLVVMGWGPSHGAPGRAESALDELGGLLPCDFLALRDRGFDPGQVLVPTAGGPDSSLSAAVATALREVHDAEVTLLHAVDPGERADGERFLADWAADHGLSDATLRVEETTDVEAAIADAAADASLLVVGATERGLVRRLLTGSLVMDLLDDVGCSVVLAERPTERSLLDRIL